VARAQRRLAPSACDPLDDAVADFAADLPPGSYSVGLAVSDAQGRRGTSRMPVVIDRPAAGLALSDLVITCGLPIVAADAPVRLEPNPARRVNGDALTAYFEIYHLQQDARGESRFEYEYLVRALSSDHRPWIQRLLSPRSLPAPVEASREETNAGSLRRQFVSVPMSQLPAGRYRLEVHVRDLASGAEVTRTVEFTHDALGPIPTRGGG
jgi:hypothetical protein